MKEAFRWKTLTAVTCRKRSVVGWFWERGGGGGFLVLMVLKVKLTVWRPKRSQYCGPVQGNLELTCLFFPVALFTCLKVSPASKKTTDCWQGLELANLARHIKNRTHARTRSVRTHRHTTAKLGACSGCMRNHGCEGQIWAWLLL